MCLTNDPPLLRLGWRWSLRDLCIFLFSFSVKFPLQIYSLSSSSSLLNTRSPVIHFSLSLPLYLQTTTTLYKLPTIVHHSSLETKTTTIHAKETTQRQQQHHHQLSIPDHAVFKLPEMVKQPNKDTPCQWWYMD